MDSNSSLLASNYQEISLGKDQLVANLFGTHVYQKGKGWGKVWHWVYNLLEYFPCGQDLRQQKLKQAMEKTDQVFQTHIQLVKDEVKKFEEYLVAKTNGVEIQDQEYAASRRHIAEWNHCILPWIEKNPVPESQTCQSVIDLEAKLNEPLPYKILIKLSHLQQLTHQETETVKAWIEKLKGAKVEISLLHSALQGIMDPIQKRTHAMWYPCLIEMEMALVKLGCEIFLQRDPEHMRWREELKPGIKISCNQHTYTIARVVSRKPNMYCQTRVYQIEENPNQLLLVGVNRAMLALRKKYGELDSWGVRQVRVRDLDRDGRCAVIEKLPELFSANDWIALSHQLNADEIAYLNPVIQQIQWFIEENATPIPFNSKSLGYDEKGVLTSTKITAKGPFDFNALEDFVLRFSQENPKMFRYLMIESGLSKHPTARFYEQVVKDTLNGEEKDLLTQAAMQNIEDLKIVERSEKLRQDVLNVLEELMRDLCNGDIQEEVMKRRISSSIWQVYHDQRTAGILWPDIKKMVTLLV